MINGNERRLKIEISRVHYSENKENWGFGSEWESKEDEK